MERLFEGRGGPMYCWCMPYRNMPGSFGRVDTTSKKETMRQLVVEENVPVGILGYDAD